MTTLGSAVLKLTVDSSGLDKGFREAEQTATTRVSDIGKTMSLTVTPAILGIGAAVFAATEDINEAMATIRTGTGATGEALQGLKDDFHAVFGEVNASSQEVANTIADFNTRLGLTGETLQGATRTALQMADAMKVDVGSVVNSTSRAMQIFGVESDKASEVMDKLFVASQRGGISIDALSGAVQTYGPVLANANFSMDETVALFTNMEAKGIDISRVMPGLNAHFRRASEEAVELGLSSEDVANSFNALIDEIKNTEDGTEALNLATEAFGAEGAQRLLIAIKSGVFELDEMTLALGRSEGAIDANDRETRTLTERMQMLTARVTEGIAMAWNRLPGPLQAAVTGFGGMLAATGPLLTAFPGLVTAVNLMAAANIRETATRVAQTAATVAATVATTAFGVAMTVATGPIGLIVLAVAGLVAGIALLIKNWDTVKAVAEAAIRRIWEVIEPVFTAIKALFDSKLGWILPGGVLIKALQYLAQYWGDIWEWIKNKFDAIVGPIMDVWDKVMGFFKKETEETGEVLKQETQQTFVEEIPAIVEQGQEAVHETVILGLGKVEEATKAHHVIIQDEVKKHYVSLQQIELEGNRARVARYEAMEARRAELRRAAQGQEVEETVEHQEEIQEFTDEFHIEMSESQQDYHMRWAEASANAYANREQQHAQHLQNMEAQQAEHLAQMDAMISTAVSGWNAQMARFGGSTDNPLQRFMDNANIGKYAGTGHLALSYDEHGRYLGAGLGTHDVHGRDNQGSRTGIDTLYRMYSSGQLPVLPGMDDPTGGVSGAPGNAMTQAEWQAYVAGLSPVDRQALFANLPVNTVDAGAGQHSGASGAIHSFSGDFGARNIARSFLYSQTDIRDDYSSSQRQSIISQLTQALLSRFGDFRFRRENDESIRDALPQVWRFLREGLQSSGSIGGLLSHAQSGNGNGHVTLMVGDREFDAYIQEAQLEGSRRGRYDV